MLVRAYGRHFGGCRVAAATPPVDPRFHHAPRPRSTLTCVPMQVSGKLLELCSHHTASRVIQFCVKYGTDADRRAIMEQVRANILELSKSKYGHFLVRKLINTAKKEDVPGGWAGVCRTVRHMQLGPGRTPMTEGFAESARGVAHPRFGHQEERGRCGRGAGGYGGCGHVHRRDVKTVAALVRAAPVHDPAHNRGLECPGRVTLPRLSCGAYGPL